MPAITFRVSIDQARALTAFLTMISAELDDQVVAAHGIDMASLETAIAEVQRGLRDDVARLHAINYPDNQRDKK